jgi:hypothetical protein
MQAIPSVTQMGTVVHHTGALEMSTIIHGPSFGSFSHQGHQSMMATSALSSPPPPAALLPHTPSSSSSSSSSSPYYDSPTTTTSQAKREIKFKYHMSLSPSVRESLYNNEASLGPNKVSW